MAVVVETGICRHLWDGGWLESKIGPVASIDVGLSHDDVVVVTVKHYAKADFLAAFGDALRAGPDKKVWRDHVGGRTSKV